MTAGTTSSTVATAGTMTLPTYRTAIHAQHGWTNRALENRCRPRLTLSEFTKTPLRDVLIGWRDDRVRWAKAKHHRAQAKPSLCIYALSSAWADTPSARCVTSKEGGISTNTGNGYYGKWQADTSFASTYHPAAARRWGPYAYAHDGKWPERDQDLMAYRGWLARGWQPWPKTAHDCGLI